MNWLSSLFYSKTWTSAASSSSVDVVEVNKSLLKLETRISIPADSVNKRNVSEFLSPMFLAHDAEIRLAVKAALSQFSYRSDFSRKSLFLAMISDSAIVKDYSMCKEKASCYVNYKIARVFRD